MSDDPTTPIRPGYYRHHMEASPTVTVYEDGSVSFETIDVQEALFAKDPHLWQAHKYMDRAGEKDPDKLVEDLRKAVWYIERRIAKAEQPGGTDTG